MCREASILVQLLVGGRAGQEVQDLVVVNEIRITETFGEFVDTCIIMCVMTT